MKRFAAFLAVSVVIASWAPVRTGAAAVQRAGDFAYVTVSEAFDGRARSGKVAARCPSGMEPTGAGGQIKAKDGALALATLSDDKDADLIAGDKGVTAARWARQRMDVRLKGYLVCMQHDEAHAYNRASADLAPDDETSVAIGCPPEHVLIGGGGGFPARQGEMRSSHKTVGFPTWFVFGRNLDDSVATLEAVAACHPDASRDIDFVTSTQISPDPGAATTHSVMCPAGQQVSAGGPSSSASILASQPVDSEADEDELPDDGWSATVLTHATGTQFTVAAVCVGDPI